VEHQRICDHVTALVRMAPQLDAATVAALIAELRTSARLARPPAQGLALAIARAVEWVAAGRVDAGIALPALAMACDTLARSTDVVALRAATEAIETLEPPAEVLIPAAAVSRGPRSRT
jgi:hypothetical protein